MRNTVVWYELLPETLPLLEKPTCSVSTFLRFYFLKATCICNNLNADYFNQL